jgi:hypothetical protein
VEGSIEPHASQFAFDHYFARPEAPFAQFGVLVLHWFSDIGRGEGSGVDDSHSTSGAAEPRHRLRIRQIAAWGRHRAPGAPVAPSR